MSGTKWVVSSRLKGVRKSRKVFGTEYEAYRHAKMLDNLCPDRTVTVQEVTK